MAKKQKWDLTIKVDADLTTYSFWLKSIEGTYFEAKQECATSNEMFMKLRKLIKILQIEEFDNKPAMEYLADIEKQVNLLKKGKNNGN